MNGATECATEERFINPQISYLERRLKKIDEFKSSINNRTIIHIAIIGVIVPTSVTIFMDIFKDNSFRNHWYFAILCVCFIIFFMAFLVTMIFGILSLFPIKESEDYETLDAPDVIFKQNICKISTQSHQVNKRYNNMRRSCLGLYVNIFSFVVIMLFYAILKIIG